MEVSRRRSKWRWLSFLVTLGFSIPAIAGWDFRTEAFITGRYREFESTPLQKINQDQFFYFREEVSYTGESWKIFASPVLIATRSQSVDIGTDPIATDLFPEIRQMHLDNRVKDEEREQAYTDVQEFYITKSWESWSMDLGRRVLALGVLKLLPVWNKFNPTAVTLRPTWLDGVDQLKLQYQSEETKLSVLGLFDQETDERAQFAMWETFKSPWQFSVLTGSWWDSHAFGASATVDWRGWLFKLESIYFDHEAKDTGTSYEDELQAGFGIERSFAQDWIGVMEILWQSKGAETQDDYSTQVRSPQQTLRGQNYVAAELRWTPNPFYTYAFDGIYSAQDQSSLQGLIITRQFGESTELSAAAFIPQGKTGSEFSPKAQVLGATNFVGAPTQYDVTLKVLF